MVKTFNVIPARSNLLLMLVCFFTLPNLVYGQTTGYYPAGAEGSKAASLPPPVFICG